MKLAGKTALVTGASSGIGRATSLRLANRGCRLVLASRSEGPLVALADEIRGLDVGRPRGPGLDAPPPLVVPTDVADPDSVARMKAVVVDRVGTPDIVVNNAGIGAYSRFDALSPEQIRRIVDVNLVGAMLCARAFLTEMRQRRSGTVVFVSSGLGEFPMPWAATYVATKYGMNGLAAALAAEVADDGVEIALVMPGGTRTEFFDRAGIGIERRARVLPGRLDPPERVAETIVRAIKKGKRRSVVGPLRQVALKLGSLMPGVRHLVLRSIARRMSSKF